MRYNLKLPGMHRAGTTRVDIGKLCCAKRRAGRELEGKVVTKLLQSAAAPAEGN
ncbi:hypothetical protein [Paenibacillus sp. S150]|uniref:hypothetical protein n=1 Tax=Paenibacillus sp. S150 TaxID=2749826 RepID=UPI001C57E18A|nr:hypothetical protein [Paenibacillus sp. S150]MBW4083504.1 hypothetical protein [Paenibacillus sp. S150]